MSANSYPLLSRWLHRIVLGWRPAAETLFDIDQVRGHYDPKRYVDQQHVFIAGLARAGTTILLRELFRSGQFSSLTYKDMPFVLSPKLSLSFANLSTTTELKERPHGDGILVNNESPEALEEVFWRTFFGEQYIFEQHLSHMATSEEAVSKFRAYVSAILSNSKQDRYLSKNNNNILRLPLIRTAFPNATIIVPFREPLQHAYSLLKQHQQFLQQSSQDSFTTEYMKWLGHFEFGKDHRPFRFGDNHPISGADTNSLDYWLELWTHVYSYLNALNLKDAIFFNYERWCDNARDKWPDLCSRLNIDANIPKELDPTRSKKAIELAYSDDKYQRAGDLFERLLINAF